METALSMHDALLLNAPEGVEHDGSLCPFCADWAMTEAGLPNGYARNEIADSKQPYGSVDYADPGYLADGVKRYPLDTEAHARAAWSFIHQASNAEMYTADQLASIRVAVQKALEKFGADAEKKEVEKTKQMADAKHGSIKPANAPSSESSASTADTQPEVASEGGTNPMETITQETHEALLQKALRDAASASETSAAALAAEVATLTDAASANAEEIASLQTENERLNSELDAAQVALKAATDEASALKEDIAQKEADAAKAEVASERAGQVKNLGLFSDEYVADKASRWADMDEAAWTERLDEWKAAKGQTTVSSTTTSTDVASAITGSSETKHSPESVSARRAALGLS
jgi:regulator of replication initiation timing